MQMMQPYSFLSTLHLYLHIMTWQLQSEWCNTYCLYIWFQCVTTLHHKFLSKEIGILSLWLVGFHHIHQNNIQQFIGHYIWFSYEWTQYIKQEALNFPRMFITVTKNMKLVYSSHWNSVHLQSIQAKEHKQGNPKWEHPFLYISSYYSTHACNGLYKPTTYLT
jgi:hypothetical protein